MKALYAICGLTSVCCAFGLASPPEILIHSAQAQKSGSNLTQGFFLYQRKEYRNALSSFIAAYKAQEDPPTACMGQGTCYYSLGDTARARQMFNFLLTNFPNSPSCSDAREWLTRIDGKSASTATIATSSAPNSISAESFRLDQPATVGYSLARGGHLLVEASINGSPVTCIFDTGAECSFFTTSQLAKAKIDLKTQRSNVVFSGTGGETQARSAVVDLSLGRAISRRQTIYIQDDSSLIRNRGGDSVFDYPLIGQDFFNDLAYTIDDRSHLITFLPPTMFPKDSEAVPFSFEGKLIIVTPKVNGRECPMILDTGASSVSFSDKALSAIGMGHSSGEVASGKSLGIGGTRVMYAFDLRSLQLGPVQRQNVRAACDLHGSIGKPLLGRSFLQGLSFTIDPKAKLIHFSN